MFEKSPFQNVTFLQYFLLKMLKLLFMINMIFKTDILVKILFHFSQIIIKSKNFLFQNMSKFMLFYVISWFIFSLMWNPK
jgi:hypothetical protein